MNGLTAGTGRWRGLLLAGVLAGMLIFTLFPRLQRKLGIFDFGLWFLDSYAVLAASDTVRAGGDPDLPMELDIRHRSHSYSDWWYGLRYLGLSRADNFLVGGSWVLLFIASAFLLLRPTSGGQALWYLSLMLAPPVLMAFIRANNDLLVFALLVAAALALRGWTAARLGLAIAAVALATGLKYYPVVGGAVFLLMRPCRRLVVVGGAAVLVLGAVFANVAPTMIKRGYFEIPQTIGSFGAGLVFHDTSLSPRQIMAFGVVVLGACTLGLSRAGPLRAAVAADRGDPDGDEEPAFVLGAVILTACFLAGLSHDYRCIFALMLAPWLWRRRAHAAVRVAIGLVTAMLWLDGLYFLLFNLLPGATADRLNPLVTPVWLYATQALVWTLMAMLAAWLGTVLLEAGRTCFSKSPERSSQV